MTKRSHYIPAVYLRSWATQQRVAVRRRDKPEPYVANVVNVGVQKHIYGAGQVLEEREKLFWHLEDEWPRLRGVLGRQGGWVAGRDRDAIALFLAFQYGRGSDHMAQLRFVRTVASMTDERPISRDFLRTYLREQHLRFDPADAELEASWDIVNYLLADGRALPDEDTDWRHYSQQVVQVIAPCLAGLRWSVETCPRPVLMTNDRPVMCWRQPSERDGYEGVGLMNCEEIRVPLTPWWLLVMKRDGIDRSPAEVPPARFKNVNRGVASQCQDFVVGRPDRVRELRQLDLAGHRPTIRFNVAPGVQVRPDGSEEEMGDVLHIWSPVHV